jgi:hypothetical protein
VEPARALLAEHEVPVEVARRELRHRGVAAVRAAQRRAHAVPRSVKLRPLRTVRPTPSSFAQPEVRLVHAALVDEVLHQAAHRVVDQRRHHRRLQAEAALEAAGDVVFAAAFPHLERARGVDAASPGSRRSITSPRLTWSQRHAALSLIARGMEATGLMRDLRVVNAEARWFDPHVREA